MPPPAESAVELTLVSLMQNCILSEQWSLHSCMFVLVLVFIVF